MSRLTTLPCVDSDEMATTRRNELDIDRRRARELGLTAVEAIQRGYYAAESGQRIDWLAAVDHAKAAKASIPPDAPLPSAPTAGYAETRVQVTNETTLAVGRRLVSEGFNPLALNFANGIHPGGGFLNGARAQEETICRLSALFATLLGDPMYEAHGSRPEPDSTDWSILSPHVPVFRTDDGLSLETFWLLDFITSAAPVATRVGEAKSAILLRKRIRRVLAIARAYEYRTLVLGAWGCGAFGNDPMLTAHDFRDFLQGEFAGAFSEVVFAIADWSPERRFLGPFRDTFSGARS